MIKSLLGLPTGPVVRKLLDHFSDMETLRDSVITHDAIEKIVQVKRDDNRYKTITTAWRKAIKKQFGIWIQGDWPEVIGIGFKVLSYEEQVGFLRTRFQRAGKHIRDGHNAAANVDGNKLSPAVRQEQQHGLAGAAHVHTALIESRRKFFPKTINPPEIAPQREASQQPQQPEQKDLKIKASG